MQLIAATAALFATLATAGPVARDTQTYYHVSNFKAGCDPHLGTCSYDFSLLKVGTGEAGLGVFCWKKDIPKDTTGLGPFPNVSGGTCDNSGRTWTVTKAADGSLTLAAQEQDSVTGPVLNGGGSHVIAFKEFTLGSAADPAAAYTGRKDFDLTYQS